MRKHCAVRDKPIAVPKVVGDMPEVCGRTRAEECDRRWIQAAPPRQCAQRVRGAAAAAVVRAKAAGERADGHHQ